MHQHATAPTAWYLWVTATDTPVDHAVDHDRMAADIADGHGEYHAVCGAAFQPAALTSRPSPVCPRCATVLRTRFEREPKARQAMRDRRRELRLRRMRRRAR